MRYWTLSIFLSFILMTACQESWQERVARQTAWESLRDCPFYVNESMIMDSITFIAPSKDSKTAERHIYYSFVDSMIDLSLINDGMLSAVHQSLVDEVRSATSLRTLKNHDCSFVYHYRLQSDGRTLHTDTVRAEDYR